MNQKMPAKKNISICVSYVNANSVINESFLTYVEISSLSAGSLPHHILTTLKENALNPINMVSQAYDGASVMSGRCRGSSTHQRVCTKGNICSLLCTFTEFSLS